MEGREGKGREGGGNGIGNRGKKEGENYPLFPDQESSARAAARGHIFEEMVVSSLCSDQRGASTPRTREASVVVRLLAKS